MARIQLQPAYVLHARAFRETSLLIEAVSRDYGRIAMVARGARGKRSKTRNILQPFRPLLLSWSARGELGTLTSADQVAAPPALEGQALFCGLYINELMIRLTHRNDPHPELFDRYRDTLGDLALGNEIQAGLRVFEKHLLESTGFGLLLDYDLDEQPLESTQWYEYRPGSGPAKVAQDQGGRPGTILGESLQALQSEEFSPEDLAALRVTMRKVIRYHLGDKPLASESLYQSPGKARASGTGTKEHD